MREQMRRKKEDVEGDSGEREVMREREEQELEVHDTQRTDDITQGIPHPTLLLHAFTVQICLYAKHFEL